MKIIMVLCTLLTPYSYSMELIYIQHEQNEIKKIIEEKYPDLIHEITEEEYDRASAMVYLKKYQDLSKKISDYINKDNQTDKKK